MAEPFKNMFNEAFFGRFANDLKRVMPDFDERRFVSLIMDGEWEKKEFKQRIAHITIVLKEFLPADYKEAIDRILEMLDHVEKTFPDFGVIDDTRFGLTLEYGCILDNYVEQYGLDDFETSVRAIGRITQFTSCEFATHAFIVRYPEQMMAQMLAWSTHPHWGVRRLASEGCRPRLPWAMALPTLKKDPAPILPILENLKNDPARSVRLSVANNLNDIAKDNPDVVVGLARKWHGTSPEVDWVIKHGCRTLLKQGHTELMGLFGFDCRVENIGVEDFQLSTPRVQIGKVLEFRFNLVNRNPEKIKIRLEYAIYFQKANGTLSKKVCKISEKQYAGNSTTPVVRKHDFKIVTTRTFHPGLHQVAVIVNGNEFEKYDFEVVG